MNVLIISANLNVILKLKRKLVEPEVIQFFTGILDISKMSVFSKMIIDISNVCRINHILKYCHT